MFALLRHGLVAVTTALFSFYVLMQLPLTGEFNNPVAATSILMVCGLGALAIFGLHSTLAGGATATKAGVLNVP
jgi:hypothetical protein